MPEMSRAQHEDENATETSHDAQYYKENVEQLKANLREVMANQVKLHKFMTNSMSQEQLQRESLGGAY